MKTIVITGASSGIGLATATLFSQRGYRVFDLSRRGTNLPGLSHIPCDFSNDASCSAAVEQVINEAGQIDVCICNAGIGTSGAVEFADIDEARQLMEVNFFGTLRLLKAVIPSMREHKAGKIIFTSSMAAILPVPYQAIYSASKSAINALALSLKNELRPFGISVTCVLPGDVQTGFTEARKKNTTGSEIYARMNAAVEKMEHDEHHGIEAEKIASLFWKIAHKKHPLVYYTYGVNYTFFCLLHRLLPISLVNWIEGKVYS